MKMGLNSLIMAFLNKKSTKNTPLLGNALYIGFSRGMMLLTADA